MILWVLSNPFSKTSSNGDFTTSPRCLFCCFTILAVRMLFWCKLHLQQYTMVSFFHVLSSLLLPCTCLNLLSLDKGFFQCFLISHKLLLLFTQHHLFLLMTQPYLLTKVIFFFPWVTLCRTICFQNQITALNELLVSSRPFTSWQHSVVMSPIWLGTAWSYSGLGRKKKHSEV